MINRRTFLQKCILAGIGLNFINPLTAFVAKIMGSYNFKKNNSRIRIIGVGGAGVQIINSVITSNLPKTDFIATDIDDLDHSSASNKVQIDKSSESSTLEIVKGSCFKFKDSFANYIEGADIVIITAGLGGKTGSGASPVIASIAKQMNVITVGIVTTPFFFEGKERADRALMGLRELKTETDVLYVRPLNLLADKCSKNISILKLLSFCNDLIGQEIHDIAIRFG